MNQETITTIDLIRHGEPDGGKKYRGQIDDPLSTEGWRQMRAAVGDHCPWQALVTSPLQRCAAFARELAERHSLPLVEEPRLKEIGFGAWEGQTAAQLEARQPGIVMAFWRDPIHHRPPGAEPLAAFQARVESAWADLAEDYRSRHILVVAHAGVMRMTLRHLLGMPLDHTFRIQVGYAALTRINLVERDGLIMPRLVFHDGRLE